VTGGASGIGPARWADLAREGCDLPFADRDWRLGLASVIGRGSQKSGRQGWTTHRVDCQAKGARRRFDAFAAAPRLRAFPRQNILIKQCRRSHGWAKFKRDRNQAPFEMADETSISGASFHRKQRVLCSPKLSSPGRRRHIGQKHFLDLLIFRHHRASRPGPA